ALPGTTLGGRSEQRSLCLDDRRGECGLRVPVEPLAVDLEECLAAREPLQKAPCLLRGPQDVERGSERLGRVELGEAPEVLGVGRQEERQPSVTLAIRPDTGRGKVAASGEAVPGTVDRDDPSLAGHGPVPPERGTGECGSSTIARDRISSAERIARAKP